MSTVTVALRVAAGAQWALFPAPTRITSRRDNGNGSKMFWRNHSGTAKRYVYSILHFWFFFLLPTSHFRISSRVSIPLQFKLAHTRQDRAPILLCISIKTSNRICIFVPFTWATILARVLYRIVYPSHTNSSKDSVLCMINRVRVPFCALLCSVLCCLLIPKHNTYNYGRV